ncbi:hypothetical protein [Streptomyces sp. SID3343]|uniref:hypothetical protein n=1 Tax=Streptomyces sp. SID3343 TaxID=2690260 RepID=UPI0013698463|nr:hypothetical protein [Streptomyces sp. SID3343]MYW03373.1 hypothetical protein [Streptomyces sp. SID3343]MYW06221.1 hypothetical protein [Streptomyces sp. SID3343]
MLADGSPPLNHWTRRFGTVRERDAAYDHDLAQALETLGKRVRAVLGWLPIKRSGTDHHNMSELAQRTWGPTRLRDALLRTPGQSLLLVGKREDELLVVRDPDDPKRFVAGSLAPRHVNLDHDWAFDGNGPVGITVPTDPERAADVIATQWWPQHEAATIRLRAAALDGGTEVVLGRDRHGRLRARVPDTAHPAVTRALEDHAMRPWTHCGYLLMPTDETAASTEHLLRHLTRESVRIRRDPSLGDPDANRRSAAALVLTSTASPVPASLPLQPSALGRVHSAPPRHR